MWPYRPKGSSVEFRFGALRNRISLRRRYLHPASSTGDEERRFLPKCESGTLRKNGRDQGSPDSYAIANVTMSIPIYRPRWQCYDAFGAHRPECTAMTLRRRSGNNFPIDKICLGKF